MTDLQPISKRIPNAKHRLFIDELFKRNMNQTAAYMAVYPDSSYDAANANSRRLIVNDSIQAEIERRLRERAMSADEVIARLADMARGSLADFADVRTVKDLEDHPLAHIVENIDEVLTEMASGKLAARLKLKLYNSQSALTTLGKYHNLFTDRIEHTGAGGGPITFTQVTVELPDEPLED